MILCVTLFALRLSVRGGAFSAGSGHGELDLLLLKLFCTWPNSREPIPMGYILRRGPVRSWMHPAMAATCARKYNDSACVACSLLVRPCDCKLAQTLLKEAQWYSTSATTVPFIALEEAGELQAQAGLPRLLRLQEDPCAHFGPDDAPPPRRPETVRDGAGFLGSDLYARGEKLLAIPLTSDASHCLRELGEKERGSSMQSTVAPTHSPLSTRFIGDVCATSKQTRCLFPRTEQRGLAV